MITPWSFYKVYLPLKLHFTSSFDVFKYKFKLPNLADKNKPKFEQRNDFALFQSYASVSKNMSHAAEICVSNLKYSSDFIYQLDKEAAYKHYLNMIKVRDSLTRNFNQELKHVKHIDDSIVPLMVRDKISTETYIVISDYLKESNFDIEKKYLYDPYINKKMFLANKYRPFFKYDKEKFFNIVKEQQKSGQDV
jgi:hypothetical protein